MLVRKTLISLDAPFTTEGGVTLDAPEVAYEEYGNPNGPVVLLCHGGLSSCHAAGRYAESDPLPGWWDGLVGPGQPFNTDTHRILSLNALGSMHGSCGPKSLNPATGTPYGPDFPAINLRDQVHFIARFLDALGVDQLDCMAGPSMGSLHTLSFAAMYPARVRRAIASATAARMPASGMAMHHFMVNALRMDPGFNDGRYDPNTTLLAQRLIWQVIKLYYTSDKIYKQACFDTVPHGPGAQQQRSEKTLDFLLAGMEAGAPQYEPNSLITVINAINTYDLGEGFATLEEGVRRIQCPVLLLNIDTDHEFPPDEAEAIADMLNAVRPGQATVRMVESPWGHLGCVREQAQLGQHMRAWLQAT